MAPAERGVRPRHIWLGAIAGNRWTSVTVDGVPVTPPGGPLPDEAQRRLGSSEIFMINSTSGTTGLPKCVAHTQNRWVYFHQHLPVSSRGKIAKAESRADIRRRVGAAT